MSQNRKPPLVYSCSGASSAAQMANHIAVKLDRLEVAERSCIASVGGDASSGSPGSADDEPCEPSSPVCYLGEFKEW